MSEGCFCFFSVKDSGGIAEHSVSQGAYKKPLSPDIYPGETGKPSKVILFSTCKNVLSVLPCSVISLHRDQTTKHTNQTPSNLTVAFLALFSCKYCTPGQDGCCFSVFPAFLLILPHRSCSSTCFPHNCVLAINWVRFWSN